jgi:DNA-binding CsgD family transcriptional regulator
VPTGAATTLLERERELRTLDGVLDDASERRGRVALIEAPAGLGKTSLLRAAAETAAERGFRCLRARANDLERDFAYGCVRQLLEAAVAPLAGVERERAFEGAAAMSRSLFNDAPAPAGADSAFSMLHGLYWLLNNLAAEEPLALVVDDLHWADAESLRFLVYLAPRLDGLPVAVLATTRPGEGDQAQLGRLRTAPEATVVRPAPLSSEATAILCERVLGSGVAPGFAEACREATGGNPFYLEALLREALELDFPVDSSGAQRVLGLGPAAVAQAVLLPLSDRPESATALVRAAAVLGDGASLAEAAGLAGLSEEEAAGAGDLLVARGILTPAEPLEFAHPIVREAVYADIGPRQRARAHAQAASLLHANGASEERIAAQIAEAPPERNQLRVELLRRVAAAALARGAPAAATTLLARALAEPPDTETRPQVLVELGCAELRLGASEAIGHLSDAVESTHEIEPRAAAARQLANALTIGGQADRAVEALENTIDVVEPEDPELALLLEAELSSHAWQASLETRAPAARRLERRGDLAGATPGERLVLASLACERARASDSAAESLRLLEDALADGRLLEEQQRDIVGPFYDLVLGLIAADAFDLAEASLEQALNNARARESIPSIAYLTNRRGWMYVRRGSVDRAEADARTGLELLSSYSIPLGLPFAVALLMEALIEAGDPDAAEAALHGYDVPDEVEPGPTSNFLLRSRAQLRLVQGRTEEGIDDMLEFGRRDELWGGANPLASRWRSHTALALLSLGDTETAQGLATEDVDLARRWGLPGGIGTALRVAALAEGGDTVVERLREAARVQEPSPARLEYARTLTDLGAALRRANSRGEARGVLEQALELADACGARAIAERARTELRAAGGRSSDPEADGIAQLTASERRVAELAAQGQSNPEIAQTLFVTRKTVETHLGHVYRKLDIAGRGQLARALSAG